MLVPKIEAQDPRFSNVASQHDVNSWDPIITDDQWYYLSTTMNQGIGMAPDLALEDSFDTCEQTLFHCCKPADFLAIRKTSGR